MVTDRAQTEMTARLVDSLYTEAMVLADEARSYFDLIGRRPAPDLTAVAAFKKQKLRLKDELARKPVTSGAGTPDYVKAIIVPDRSFRLGAGAFRR